MCAAHCITPRYYLRGAPIARAFVHLHGTRPHLQTPGAYSLEHRPFYASPFRVFAQLAGMLSG
ncbi:MAG: hypothetical protein C4296_00355 [Gemmataceae bacterium]